MWDGGFSLFIAPWRSNSNAADKHGRSSRLCTTYIGQLRFRFCEFTHIMDLLLVTFILKLEYIKHTKKCPPVEGFKGSFVACMLDYLRTTIIRFTSWVIHPLNISPFYQMFTFIIFSIKTCDLNCSVRGRASSSRTRFWTLPNLNSEVSAYLDTSEP